MKDFPSESSPGHHDYLRSHDILKSSSFIQVNYHYFSPQSAAYCHVRPVSAGLATFRRGTFRLLQLLTDRSILLLIIISIIMQSATKDHLWYRRFHNKDEAEIAVYELLGVRKSDFYREGSFKVCQGGQ
jgi:hypothetical protein